MSLDNLKIFEAMFWNNFWPNFISTILGLILGLPIALWANRIIENSQSRKKLKVDKARLSRTIDILNKTLEQNRGLIQESMTLINDHKIQFEIIIDTSTWDAVKNEVIEFLHEPTIQKRLAYHFLRLRSFRDLYHTLFEHSKGIAATISGNERTKDVLKRQLTNSADFLLSDTDEILTLLKQINK
jgi:hypothetical protein